MKLLILGGSGFVSGRLASMAQAQGHEVWVVTRGSRPIDARLHSLIADRNDGDALGAALAGAGTRWDAALDCICYNAHTAAVDLAVLPEYTKRLIVVSTDSVYHPAFKRIPQNEEGVYLHDGGYGAKKREMEEVFLYAGAPEKLAVTIFRPGHIFGPGSKLGCYPEHTRQENLIDWMKEGKPLCLVGGGQVLLHPIYVDDLCQAMLDSIAEVRTHQQVFCIGGPDVVTNAAYFELLAELLGVDVHIEEVALEGYLEAHPQYSGHLCHRVYCLDKLRDTGIATPATHLREGLMRQVEYLLAQEQQEHV